MEHVHDGLVAKDRGIDTVGRQKSTARVPRRHSGVLGLQQAAGNRAVAGMLASGRTPAVQRQAIETPIIVQRDAEAFAASLDKVNTEHNVSYDEMATAIIGSAKSLGLTGGSITPTSNGSDGTTGSVGTASASKAYGLVGSKSIADLDPDARKKALEDKRKTLTGLEKAPDEGASKDEAEGEKLDRKADMLRKQRDKEKALRAAKLDDEDFVKAARAQGY